MATKAYPCVQCGAKLQFAPGQHALKCPYCGAANEIAASSVDETVAAVEELDYDAYLSKAGDEPPIAQQTVKCGGCGAQSQLAANVVSDRCTFCAAPLAASDAYAQRVIAPKALVPFDVQESQARDSFKEWIGHLWFAPNALRKAYHADRGLKGLYVPYWTYDAQTQTPYLGQRGRKYYETESYLDNGETKTRKIERIEWRPVRGSVEIGFDDVLVVGSRTLPDGVADKLAPWDLAKLAPYRDEFVSGFAVEAYQVGLAPGFAKAREVMEDEIRSAIRSDIGGDDQRIDSMDPRFANVTFKHILLPVWQSAYRYGDKQYHFIVNGQTGAVQGERPWSTWKIGFAVLLVLLLVYLGYLLLR